jgi:hypothetical protein
MGILNLFSKAEAPKLERLPSGSFTVDKTGRIVVSTLPQNYPTASAQQIAKAALEVFKSAKEANLLFTEFFVHYGSMKITAREQRGGAIIFLAPRATK